MNRFAAVMGTALGLAAVTGPLPAQELEYINPQCELETNHFLVSGAITYLKNAHEEEALDKRQQLLTDARRNLIEAIERDQAENPAVWYFLARVYVVEANPVGADSAFTRVEALQPDCAEDIGFYRESMWVYAVNRGIDSLHAGSYEGAKLEFGGADAVYDEANVAIFYLGQIYADEGNTDSALIYFKRVVDLGTADSARIDNYEVAVENVAVLYQLLGQWDSAAVWYERFSEVDPGNSDARFGLAEAYINSGRSDDAVAIYSAILGNAATMSDLDLFHAGTKLFSSDQFDLALQAFETGLQKNPYHRDALFNLANTYLAIANDVGRSEADRNQATSQMVDVASRLAEIDTQNRNALRLLAASYQLQSNSDSTDAVLQRIDAMPFEVVVDVARPIQGGYQLMGRIVNLGESQAQVPTITFEFLTSDGSVFASDKQSAAALESGSSTRFSFTQVGEIAAYRYKVGT